ncbi:MAG: hypothetical protein KJ958_15320 [Gammaproteobacteria bacterium]|nr:hypothetical protein [Gammaproteobacteria bacterium]MBU1980527.1 hypothetical protein [Gammaproteobacteria bacterium]
MEDDGAACSRSGASCRDAAPRFNPTDTTATATATATAAATAAAASQNHILIRFSNDNSFIKQN